MDLPAPPLPASNGSRPRQMVLAEAATTPRGWDNGVGGYQTNSILETRIGGTQEGRKLGDLQFSIYYIPYTLDYKALLYYKTLLEKFD